MSLTTIHGHRISELLVLVYDAFHEFSAYATFTDSDKSELLADFDKLLASMHHAMQHGFMSCGDRVMALCHSCASIVETVRLATTQTQITKGDEDVLDFEGFSKVVDMYIVVRKVGGFAVACAERLFIAAQMFLPEDGRTAAVASVEECAALQERIMSFAALETMPVPWAALLVVLPSTPACLLNTWRLALADTHLCLMGLLGHLGSSPSGDLLDTEQESKNDLSADSINAVLEGEKQPCDSICRLMLQLNAFETTLWYRRLANAASELDAWLILLGPHAHDQTQNTTPVHARRTLGVLHHALSVLHKVMGAPI